jgi:arylsulfatase A-like enzyme
MQRASFAPSFPLDPPLSAEEQASLIDGYDNCLSYLDNEVGNLVDFLSRSPVGSNTVIIITSDHGEAFNEHQSYLHGRSLHREVLRVPLIFLGPGIPQGQRWRDPVRIRDLFATILDLALRESPLFHSSSLRRHWLPAFQTGPWDGWAISELVPFLPGFRPVMLSLMTSEWHYIHDSTGQVELYRWPVDPQETTNLAGHPEYQQLLIELHHRLEMLLGSSVRPWRGVEYLYALDRPGHSFLRETAFGASLPLQDLGTRPRVGSVQALFAPDPRSSQRLITEPDEQLIKSLPYR